MKESTPPVLKVSLPEAEELLQAEALEAHPPMGWSAAESDAASRDALAVAGKSDIQAFLLTRAKLVLSRMTKQAASAAADRVAYKKHFLRHHFSRLFFWGCDGSAHQCWRAT